MSIATFCPRCWDRLQFAAEAAGRRACCQACGQWFEIPAHAQGDRPVEPRAIELDAEELTGITAQPIAVAHRATRNVPQEEEHAPLSIAVRGRDRLKSALVAAGLLMALIAVPWVADQFHASLRPIAAPMEMARVLPPAPPAPVMQPAPIPAAAPVPLQPPAPPRRAPAMPFALDPPVRPVRVHLPPEPDPGPPPPYPPPIFADLAREPIEATLDAAGNYRDASRFVGESPVDPLGHRPCQTYHLRLDGGKAYEIEMVGDLLQACLLITDGAGEMIDQAEASEENRAASLRLFPPAAGFYRIYVCDAQGRTGTYALTVRNAGAGPVRAPGAVSVTVAADGSYRDRSAIAATDPAAPFHGRPCREYRVKLEGNRGYTV